MCWDDTVSPNWSPRPQVAHVVLNEPCLCVCVQSWVQTLTWLRLWSGATFQRAGCGRFSAPGDVHPSDFSCLTQTDQSPITQASSNSPTCTLVSRKSGSVLVSWVNLTGNRQSFSSETPSVFSREGSLVLSDHVFTAFS